MSSCSLGWHLEPDERARALGPELNDRPLRESLSCASVCPTNRAPVSETMQLGRPGRRLLGEVGIDALLPAVRALGAEPEPLRCPPQPGRLEVRGLEQDLGRVLGDLRLLAAHDPGERDRALGVGDHQVGGLEIALDAVQRSQLLARARAPRTTIFPPASFAWSNACSGLPSPSIT